MFNSHNLLLFNFNKSKFMNYVLQYLCISLTGYMIYIKRLDDLAVKIEILTLPFSFM